MVILMQKKRSLTADQWRNLVNETKTSLLKNLDDFFCGELPPSETTTDLVEEVFKNFLMDLKIRSIQRKIVIPKENADNGERPKYTWIKTDSI